MPGRLLETMASSPRSSVAEAATENKRRSGRVTRKPEAFAPQPASSVKRKRSQVQDGQDDVEDEIDEGSDSEEQDEEEPGDEELRDQKSRKTKGTPAKPAQKKSKTNGAAVNLPIRSTAAKARRPKKKAKAMDMTDAEEAGGLYAEVFARDHTLDDVVAQWIAQFNEHESRALADLVNFVLKSAGCELQIDEHDIGDPDNCTNKLGDLQDEFQAVSGMLDIGSIDSLLAAKHHRLPYRGQNERRRRIQGLHHELLQNSYQDTGRIGHTVHQRRAD